MHGVREIHLIHAQTAAKMTTVARIVAFTVLKPSEHSPPILLRFDQLHSCATLLLSLSLNPAEAQADTKFSAAAHSKHNVHAVQVLKFLLDFGFLASSLYKSFWGH